jgi:transcriptional regulator with XRE-family HTH domain
MSAIASQWSGEEIARARRAAGLTQAQVAEALGCRRQRIQNVEASRRVTDRARNRILLAIARLRDEGDR